MSRSPINHSELAEFLRKQLDELRQDVLGFASGGVVEDGGAMLKQGVQSVPTSSKSPVALPGADTGFVWSDRSKRELQNVKAELVECADLALKRFTRIDFMCYDGIRTLDEQRKHVANGTSKTMDSKHLKGLAVDLVPIIGGIPKWDWNGCYEIACAMDKAATHRGVANHIIWGGAWDKRLSQYGGEAAAYAQAVQEYRTRHAGSDFIDGPHFEWVD